MRPRRGYLGVCTTALLSVLVAVPSLAGDTREFEDSDHDAIPRRTDPCNCGQMLPDLINFPNLPNARQRLPDVKAVNITAWEAASPDTDPYTGWEVSHNGAHLVRIDIRLEGLINPPGTLGLNGLPYEPFVFGTNPLYGFIEIDVDNDKDTGGDSSDGDAPLHFLANAARFGGLPSGPISVRAAQGSSDLFESWTHPPQIQLSGADWIMPFCGCFATNVVSQSTPCATFGPGATWVVEGRFFQRSSGYSAASLMLGGSGPGRYDPMVRLRFKHRIDEDETTVSLVYPLDQVGAALLAGRTAQQAQAFDQNVSNDTSIAEGVADLINAAQRQLPYVSAIPQNSLQFAIMNRWASKSPAAAVDITRWRPTFIVGTAYSTPPPDGFIIWTDVGFGVLKGDVNGDGVVDELDRAAIVALIAEKDGGIGDADGAIDGRITLGGFGSSYSVFDIDGDGFIGPLDVAFYDHICAADFNHSGTLSAQDIFDFLSAWFDASPIADFNHSGTVSVQDIFDFLAAWFTGC